MSPDLQRLKASRDRFHAELYDRVLPFWMKNAPDREYGGTFNCLDRDGRIWDTTKHMWLQGRLVWMMSKLYNTTLPDPAVLDVAKLGADFLTQKAYRADNRVYFSLTREGQPKAMQRKIFSECFYSMALAEFARATEDPRLRYEARRMLETVVEYAKDATLVGRPAYPHLPPTSSLAPYMIILNMVDELHEPGETTYDAIAQWCAEGIEKHIKPELELVLEHVGANGELLDSPDGRVVNPGHAIECAWFLMAYAKKKGDKASVQRALKMIDWSFDFGWDSEFGGIYYFLDREGMSPPALEWSMKLWWPHCEAMIAYLMAWRETGEQAHWDKFQMLTDWSFEHFSDPEFGEWFGYLDRRGERTHTYKGAPYKGFFHVPRALYLCDNILTEAVAEMESQAK
ncbi:MAG: N-acylglucosamine 2-epimerase [Candidatus Sumerlaeota bacterium]|nr:N-acylglucosamine 2-epimerase [Candidatus Sumerlaeota bacterium]